MKQGTLTCEERCGPRPVRERAQGRSCYSPRVDILESATEWTVYADVPGSASEDIDLRFEKGTLTLHAPVKPRRSDKMNLLVREFGVGDFHRTFEAGEAIDGSRVTAECVAGVLTLHLPKVEAVPPRRIAIHPA